MAKKLTQAQKDRRNLLARQRRAKKRSDFVKFKPKRNMGGRGPGVKAAKIAKKQGVFGARGIGIRKATIAPISLIPAPPVMPVGLPPIPRRPPRPKAKRKARPKTKAQKVKASKAKVKATARKVKKVRSLISKEINRQMKEVLKIAGKNVRGKKKGKGCTVQGTDAATRKRLLKKFL